MYKFAKDVKLYKFTVDKFITKHSKIKFLLLSLCKCNFQYKFLAGVYREVRSIRPESDQQNSHLISSNHIRFILLGFKSLDKNFNQVLIRRNIYYLITFYQK